jgi:hypothetical protein
MSVRVYIFYLVVVLRDKLKIFVLLMYGLVKYNFYGVLLIKRQHFDCALIGKATERTFAVVFSLIPCRNTEVVGIMSVTLSFHYSLLCIY